MLAIKPFQTGGPTAMARSQIARKRPVPPASKAPAPAVRVSVLHESFEAQADLRPTAVAIAFGPDKMSYGPFDSQRGRRWPARPLLRHLHFRFHRPAKRRHD